jgi:hypothetical protein
VTRYGQVVAQVHASKPSAVVFGADGAPITLPLDVISWISSEAFRFAG